MKNVTIISGYYSPEDTAVGLYNSQMVQYLKGKGYEITVITGFPNYPQWRIWNSYRDKPTFFKEYTGAIKVLRYKQYVPKHPNFVKRILLILDFTFGGLVNIFKVKECDLVISVVPYTSCTFLGWVLKKRKKAKLWNHIQDFEFDAALQAGVSKKPGILKSFFFKVLFGLEQFLFNQADINSTISNSMIAKLKTKSSKKIVYFPNWISEGKFNLNSSKTHKYLNSKKFKVLYSGNIGDKQDWAFFLEFARALTDYEIDIVLVGDGAKREWLCEAISTLDNVSYYPPVKYLELNDLLSSADMHFLFQKNDVIDSVMPSKLLGMMASGKPSLVTGNRASEVKDIIDNSGGGVYIYDRDLKRCVNNVLELSNSVELSKKMGFKAKAYVLKEFASSNVLEAFEKELSSLIKKPLKY